MPRKPKAAEATATETEVIPTVEPIPADDKPAPDPVLVDATIQSHGLYPNFRFDPNAKDSYEEQVVHSWWFQNIENCMRIMIDDGWYIENSETPSTLEEARPVFDRVFKSSVPIDDELLATALLNHRIQVSPNPPKRRRRGGLKPPTPVDIADVVSIKDVMAATPVGEPVSIKPLIDPKTKLSQIDIFDNVENADNAITYKIPEDPFEVSDDDNEPIILKGRGGFVDRPDSFNMMTWIPLPEQTFFVEKDGMIVAQYLVNRFNVPEDRHLLEYIIAKKHYKERIPDLIQHINYFESFYDHDHEYLVSTLATKDYIDHHPTMTQKAFCRMVDVRIITPTLVRKVKHMALDLYRLNINTDKDGKYKTTPKITNDHARMIVAVSFCIRLILPLCIHFSNTNATFINKRDYIDCFDRIFMKVVQKFEKNDTEIWNPICRFVAYRVERSQTTDAVIWEKKKQLYGTTMELYLETLIHEVILVKSLHKLAYNRSIVSFIDGIITHSYMHYRYENFKFKPVEIENEDSDSDDYLSHVEALEMQISRVDESNQLVNETNIAQVMASLEKRFNVPIAEGELEFYVENIHFNSLMQSFLHAFFSKYFNDTNAIRLLDRRRSAQLALYLKKYLQLRGMVILPQICTARVHGKFKDTCIKNAKFLEKFTTSSVYQHIIADKYRYIAELHLKEDPIVKMLSTMLNSSFEFCDFDPEINGRVAEEFDTDMLVSEFMTFLSIC